MGFKMCLHNDTGTISAIPYAVLTLVIFGLFLVGMGVIVDALVEVDNQMMGMTTATTPRPTVAPTPAPELVQVSGGDQHSLALWSNGTVVAWGDPWNEDVWAVPEDLQATAIAAGGDHSLALTPSGEVVAWGANYDGQCDVPADLTATAISAVPPT